MKINVKYSKIISVFILLVILNVSITSVYAYTLTGAKWKSSTITYYYYNYNSSRGKEYIEKGANAWQSTDANLKYTPDLNNYNIACSEVSRTDVDWDGLTTARSSGGILH